MRRRAVPSGIVRGLRPPLGYRSRGAALVTAVVVVLTLLATIDAVGQEARLPALVEQIAGADIYLRIGTERGLAPGDTLAVYGSLEGGGVLGRFVVIAAATDRSVVEFAGPPFAVTRGATLYVGAPGRAAPVAPPPADPVEALRQRLAGRSAREHVVLDFLSDDLREVREVLGGIQRYVQGIERAVADPRLTPQQLLALAQGSAPVDQLDYLGEMLASTRRRLGQVAARM